MMIALGQRAEHYDRETEYSDFKRGWGINHSSIIPTDLNHEAFIGTRFYTSCDKNVFAGTMVGVLLVKQSAST